MYKIGFGGGCHWCTEAVFQFLKGVTKVEQGWISSKKPNDYFSEAILLEYNPNEIDLDTLVAIHLHTHSSTANHSMRVKYRSAVYFFTPKQEGQLSTIMKKIQQDFDQKIITSLLPFKEFKINKEQYRNYYEKNKENSFCKLYIHPKLKILLSQFSKNTTNNLKQELPVSEN